MCRDLIVEERFYEVGDSLFWRCGQICLGMLDCLIVREWVLSV